MNKNQTLIIILQNVFVADFKNNRIQKFQLFSACRTGTTQVVIGVCFATKWGTPDNGNGQFNSPSDVATDSSLNVFVAYYGNNRIQKFRNDRAFITAWAKNGPDSGAWALETIP